MATNTLLPWHPIRYVMLARKASRTPQASAERRYWVRFALFCWVFPALLIAGAAAVDAAAGTLDVALAWRAVGALGVAALVCVVFVWVATCGTAAEKESGDGVYVKTEVWMREVMAGTMAGLHPEEERREEE